MSKSYFFDQRDRHLLTLINDVIDHGPSGSVEQQVFNVSLHPHGIQNMTNSHEFRMALAVINLLGRLDDLPNARERLTALKILHDEVIHSAQSAFRINTGRVLIQIMKDIVRSRGDEEAQLRLIHDFQKVATGNPRIVRQFLSRYFLLEMPEEWNQKTLDDHVHDSSTQGRKTPTYLIMDAWIKGIRRLTVVYYNYVDPHVAVELLRAAKIMDITVRIGLKLQCVHNGRYVEFLYSPRGFQGPAEFIEFLKAPATEAFMQNGREAQRWINEKVFETLKTFSTPTVRSIGHGTEICVPALSKEAFRTYLGDGQAPFLRLAEFIHLSLKPTLTREAERLKALLEESANQPQAKESLEALDCVCPQWIFEHWIAIEENSAFQATLSPIKDGRPDILLESPTGMLTRIRALESQFRLTLLLGGLKVRDVLELLWDTEGAVTHLELFNMKEWQAGRLDHIKEINRLQVAINNKNVLELKRILLTMLEALPAEHPKRTKLAEMLEKLPLLLTYYSRQELGSRFGTDSTSRLGTRYGMGLVLPETLPASAQKHIRGTQHFRPLPLPLRVRLAFSEKYAEPTENSGVLATLRRLTGLRTLGLEKKVEWLAKYGTASVEEPGNVVTLGGTVPPERNGFMKKSDAADKMQNTASGPKRNYLNTTVLNILKVLIGFIPAFATFMLTQNWWVLAWFGALIWFSVTGVRNIIQAVIAGGGFHKTMLVSWKQLINWSRVADSLMFTGISVILLEGLTRNVLLGHLLGITVDKAPLLVFSIIALANGLYIASHNIFRGFPRSAVVGNLFRSVLAIPVAMIYNMILQVFLPFVTSMNVEDILVPAAAIVTKFASDTVAGIIESSADRQNNYRLRRWDYETGLHSLFDCFTRLELTFPNCNLTELMRQPDAFIRLVGARARTLEIECIAISLDFMYFWYYQPCAQKVLTTRMAEMSADERLVFVRFQSILSDHKEVATVFLEGLLGEHFSRSLAFYLDNYREYLEAIDGIRSYLDGKDLVPTPLGKAAAQSSEPVAPSV